MAGQLKDTAELERIEAAFRRAAHRALHGTREERSGRFLPARAGTPRQAEDASQPSKKTSR